MMCAACARGFSQALAQENTPFSILDWIANRARKAEHKRMQRQVVVLEEKLRIEVATTDGLIRKYGKTITEIGDMNAK
jgi:hypothetical protein